MKLRKFIFTLLAAGCLAATSEVHAQTYCVDAYEPSDNIQSAPFFPLNSQLDAGIPGASDVDYYRFDITSSGLLSLALANLTADFDLQLLDANGNLITSSTWGGSSYESINYQVSPGRYYAKVFGYNGATSNTCYRLINGFTTTGCNDSYESNETLAAAKSIPVGTHLFARIATDTDNDWYSFSTISPNTNIQVFLLDLTVDIDIQLHNASGQVVASSVATAGRNEVITFNTATAGTWYIRVYGFNGSYSSQCYSLRVNTFYQPFAASPFRLEANAEKAGMPDSKDGQETSAVTFYPNPAVAGQEVTLAAPAGMETLTVRILTTNGMTVSKQEVEVSSGQARISLAGIEPGLYLIDAVPGAISRLVVK